MKYKLLILFLSFMISVEVANSKNLSHLESYRVQAFSSVSEPQKEYKKCSSYILSLYKIDMVYYVISDLTTYGNAMDIVNFLEVECKLTSWIRPLSMEMPFDAKHRIN